jgi:hypothetical protein
MKRQLVILFVLTAVLVSAPIKSADAVTGGGRVGGGHGVGRGVSHGVGRHGVGRGFGLGFGGGYDDGCDFAELYRELLKNVPYFALHPPVYYSYPVPRTYGYSPFAYLPGVMTPDVMIDPQPLEIINPHVPSTKSDKPAAKADTTAAASRQPEPLVIINPYVASGKALARAEQ